MKIAVTGASGYLGRLVVTRLEADPNVESVLGLDVRPPAYQASKMHSQSADVRSADFRRLLAGCHAVYHLAFMVDPRRGVRPEQFDQVNIDGSRRLFDAAIQTGVRRIVFASSNSAYGAHRDNPDIFHEDAPRRPNENWYYSRAKGRVEAYLDTFEQRHPDATVIRFRPTMFVGPHMDNTLRKSLGARRVVFYNANMRTNCCWDADVADAFWRGLYHETSDAFNLAGDGCLGTGDFGELLGKRIIRHNHRLAVSVGRVLRTLGFLSQGEFEWLNVGFRAPILLSNQKAKTKLGWQPRYTSREAVRKWAELLA